MTTIYDLLNNTSIFEEFNENGLTYYPKQGYVFLVNNHVPVKAFNRPYHSGSIDIVKAISYDSLTVDIRKLKISIVTQTQDLLYDKN